MLAIIPARGGSKGLPGKNIKNLNGKPLIAYSIEAALSSKHITRVIVSTDDEEIAAVAQQYGAEVPFLRPAHLATDTAKAIDVFQHLLDSLRDAGDIYDEVIILQPTSPLRKMKHIDEAIELYTSKKADSVISYCKEQHPITWHKYITDEGKFENIFEDNIDNRQAFRPSYYPNGSIYIIKSALLYEGVYVNENSFAYIMDRKYSIDIDYAEDFEYCEFLLKK